ncbi:SCO3374 family protein [Streptomyces sp. AN091965]|uniref:SCO3374 family protein n=1 Tax=Streptomyces sp. AN091965 TaxID=2927803 RepID=UPI001F60DEEE|nr:SCO3374 family protein [Streptomyces sp. AN091965]MCI3932214.1 SCO3374 family protein [Streptomyces sp. AN091965]
MALPSVPHPRPSAEPRTRRAEALGDDPVRRWYERELGWPVRPGPGPGAALRLVTGVRFDVLQLPAEAGFAALRHLGPKAPVALHGGTMRLLVAAGSADELPGLLDWLEWGGVPLDLTAIGTGGLIDAPTPPGLPGSRGAAVWLRPPEPGHDVEAALPSLTTLAALAPRAAARALDGSGTDPHSGSAAGSDLVRLVDTAATQCHRVRLRRASNQPLAFS